MPGETKKPNQLISLVKQVSCKSPWYDDVNNTKGQVSVWRAHEESNWDLENELSEGAKVQNMLRCFRFELLFLGKEKGRCLWGSK